MKLVHWALQKLALAGLFLALPGCLVYGLWKGALFNSTWLWYFCVLAGPCLVLWLVFRDWKAYRDVE